MKLLKIGLCLPFLLFVEANKIAKVVSKIKEMSPIKKSQWEGIQRIREKLNEGKKKTVPLFKADEGLSKDETNYHRLIYLILNQMQSNEEVTYGTYRFLAD